MVTIKTASAVRELVKKAKDSSNGEQANLFASAAMTLLHIELQSEESNESSNTVDE